jgi:antitoxin VapB
MDGSQPVRITRDGDHQVVHLPSGVTAPTDAVVRQEGGRLIIEQAGPVSSQKQKLLDRLATLEAIEEDFGPIEDAPPRPVRF